MTGHKAAVSSVALHPSGRVAMSVGLDAGLRLWDLARGKTSYCSMCAPHFPPPLPLPCTPAPLLLPRH